MAIYSLSAKIISRKAGHSAVAAAAYRSGTSLRDERRGDVQDYTPRAKDVLFSGIFAPQDAPAWACDREQLWNHVEQGEKRKDAQLTREMQIALPHELTDQQREWLVKDYVREQFTRRGLVVDAAIHAPDRQGDARNFHAHLLVTMRTIDADGFSPTKDRELNNREQLTKWREEWAKLANRHLERHGIEARLDPRSHAARGIEAEPTKHEGSTVTQLERRGIETDRRHENDEIRARNAALIPQPASNIILPADRTPAVPADLWERGNDAPPGMQPSSAPAPAGRDSLTPPPDLWERGGDMPPSMPASIARQLAPDQRTGLDAPPDLWERDESPEATPNDERRRGTPQLTPDLDWTSRGGMVAQQASAAIWAKDAARRAGNAPTPDDINRQQTADRDALAASPVATQASEAARQGEASPAPAASKSAQEFTRDEILAAFDEANAQSRERREQDMDGGRELDR